MKTFSNLQIHQLESEFTGQLSATKGGGKILARSRKKFRERRQSSKKVLLWVEGSSKLLSSNYLPSLACPFAEREYFPWSVFNKGILLCLGLKSGTCLNHPLPLFFFFLNSVPQQNRSLPTWPAWMARKPQRSSQLFVQMLALHALLPQLLSLCVLEMQIQVPVLHGKDSAVWAVSPDPYKAFFFFWINK